VVIDHVGEWTKLWRDAGLLGAKHSVGWPSRYAREAFELLRTTLVYQRNALADYSDGALHQLVRPDAARLTTDDSIFGVSEPVFRSLPSPCDSLGGAHLASASFRLPVAMYQTFQVCSDARAPFVEQGTLKTMLKTGRDKDDWWRIGFTYAFETVKRLRHCADAPLGSSVVEGLRQAIVIVLVHRDDFGHGEEGSQRDEEYFKLRESVLDSLHACRVVEAQQSLIRWNLKHLNTLLVRRDGGSAV
jgi:hypothetical protein